MKQTFLSLTLFVISMLWIQSIQAQTEPHFASAAYVIHDGASVTTFDLLVADDEMNRIKSELLNCGPNITVTNTKITNGYHVILKIEEQTGPEYVAKLMMVVGVQHYFIGTERKEISQLEADLIK